MRQTCISLLATTILSACSSSPLEITSTFKPKSEPVPASTHIRGIELSEAYRRDMHSSHESNRWPVTLGDTEATMLRKLKSAKARDVTNQTSFAFCREIEGEQKFYWWEMPDKTVIAIRLTSGTGTSLQVMEVEMGEPGQGVAGIARWPLQKLKSIWRSQKLQASP